MITATQPTATVLPAPALPNREELLRLFIKQSGFAEHSIVPLAGDASFRRYVRVLTPKTSYVVMDSPPDKEPVRAYITVCDFLVKQGFSAPRIIALDEESGFLLLEDLGDNVFTQVLDGVKEELSAAVRSEKESQLYTESVKLLAHWHQKPGLLKGNNRLAIGDYTLSEYMRELRLFTDWYLPELQDSQAAFGAQEFLTIWQQLLMSAPLAGCYLVHRDFHANNLVWLEGRKDLQRVGLLDFQDALWGDCSYDLVSLLQDARRDVPPELARDMRQLYLSLTKQPKELFDTRYAILGAQRNLKIIGIFMRLNKRDSKPHYLNYLPRVWGYLENSLAHPSLSALNKWVKTYIPADIRPV